MNQNQLEQIRAILRGCRMAGETNMQLTERVLRDNRVLTTLMSILPQCHNVCLVQHVLKDPDFIQSL